MVEVQDDDQVDVGKLSAVGKNYSIELQLRNSTEERKPGQQLGDSIEAFGARK